MDRETRTVELASMEELRSFLSQIGENTLVSITVEEDDLSTDPAGTDRGGNRTRRDGDE